jgi:hypothetical protein
MVDPLNSLGALDKILEQGIKATESTANFWGNVTKEV